jgi:uncharacterized protein (DUF1778 family)
MNKRAAEINLRLTKAEKKAIKCAYQAVSCFAFAVVPALSNITPTTSAVVTAFLNNPIVQSPKQNEAVFEHESRTTKCPLSPYA